MTRKIWSRKQSICRFEIKKDHILPMKIGGFQKSSLIDYPDKICCIIFVSGCNFHCPYCHNPELINGNYHSTPYSDENLIFEFLEKRKSMLDGVVITGGEPTLYEEIFELCHTIKKIGYPVKIDTNGSRPNVVKKLIEEDLVDYIAMDIKTTLSNYSPLIQENCNPEDLMSSIRLIMDSKKDYEFRTTCVKPLVSLEIIEEISIFIMGARLYTLQGFNDTKVLNPDFFHEDDSNYTGEDLEDMLDTAKPWVRQCIIR
ncbi:MAG: anaerobic ribonucleoside-triphosphate reductase activating protein [Desulfobacteraceae bacterium]|nr:anaerobic ribonucleoside-triphosphate reductase activating protein [Desulfobacteraceae bacterium]